MKKLLKGIFALVLAASCITSLPVQKVNAEVSVPLVEADWDIAAYLINSDTVSEYGTNTGSGDGPARHMIDNKASSWWHSNYNGTNGDGNYSIVVEFNKTLTFDKIQGTGRSAANGKIENFEIYYINNDDASATISANSDQWIQLADTTNAVDGGFLYDCGTTITATHVKINVHDTTGGDNRFGCLAELDFLKTYNNYVEAETATPLDDTSFTVTVSGTNEGDKGNIFDGDATTFWTSQQVDHVNNGGAWLQVDLGDVELINRVDYTKRYYDSNSNRWKCTGNIREYIIEVKENESDAWKQVSTGDISFDEDTSIYNDVTQGGTHQIEFDAVKARYVRIRANSTYHHQAANVNKYMTVADLAIYPANPNVVAYVENKTYDDSTTESFVEAKVNTIKAMSSGTVQITYKVTDPTVDKKMVLFAVSNNATNSGDNYAIWVKPSANKIGVDINGGTGNILNSTHGVNANNTDWHTITIRNVNANNTFAGADNNGVYMQFDEDYRSGNKYTGDARTGFATSVANANSVTTGYVDFADEDELHFSGVIADLKVYSNVLSNEEVIANHRANITKANGGTVEASSVVANRWVKNYIKNDDYIYESGYDAIGNEPIQIVGSLTSEQYLLRYVDKNVLSVKAQAKAEEDGEYKLRFVTSVASLNPEECGFEFVIKNGESVFKEKTIDCSTVYNTISEGDSFVEANDVFNNSASTYFATFSISNIPTDVENYTITLKPYWIPYGDTNKVYGVEKTYTLGDLFDSIPAVVND